MKKKIYLNDNKILITFLLLVDGIFSPLPLYTGIEFEKKKEVLIIGVVYVVINFLFLLFVFLFFSFSFSFFFFCLI